MRTMLAFFLLAAGMLAQAPPADTLKSKIAERLSAFQNLQAEAPGAVEEYRSERAEIVRLPNGQRRATFARNLSYVDPDTGEITNIKPVLWTTPLGWVVLGGPVKTRIAKRLVGSNYRVAEWFKDPVAGWQSFSLTVATVSHTGDFKFTFNDQGQDWVINVGSRGFELSSAPIPAPLGSKTYTLSSSNYGLSLAVDPRGDLVSGRFRLTRPVMAGADGERYPCSAWSLGAQGALSFTCDDSVLPVAAFPYVIDPTSTFYPDAHIESTSVDGYVYRSPMSDESFSVIRAGAGTYVDDSYTTAGVELWTQTTVNTFSKLTRAIMLFDTSTLPDNAVITSATLNLNKNVTGTNLGATTLEIVSSTPASNTALVTTDYSQLGTVSYGSISSFANGYNTITLNSSGIAAISKTGVTKLGARLGWDLSGSFTGTWVAGTATYFSWFSADQSGTSQDPYLSVTYTLPGGPRLIVVGEQ